MTLEQFLSECERLDKEATKGPWSAGPQNGNYGHNIMADLGRTLIASTPQLKTEYKHDENSANANFMGHARTALPLLAEIMRAIVERQHTRDLSSDPAVYIEFNPIWIAYEILSGAQDGPLTTDELVRRQKVLDDYNQDAAEQRFYDAQSSPASNGGAE